jgi:hypothetical protein
LDNWKAAGGRDANAMLYGDWANTSASYLPSFGLNILFSHYSYRNVPFWNRRPWHVYQYDGVNGSGVPYFAIAGTKPIVKAHMAAPMFRTLKELGGRALMSDTFSKGQRFDGLGRDWYSTFSSTTEPLATSQQVAGMGVAAHRQVYNVLYGDWHTGVYGDPQERVLWHTQGSSVYSSTTIYSAAVEQAGLANSTVACNFWDGGAPLGASSSSTGPFNGTTNPGAARFAHTPLAMWHDFDTAADVDK